jgi:hypothetical protein
MKIFFTLAILVATIFSSVAYAGTTICSGKLIHYLNDRYDYGMVPPVGHKIGEMFISIRGKLILDEEFIMGGDHVEATNIHIEETGKRIAVSSSGNRSAGTSIYYVIMQVIDGTALLPLAKEMVLCRTGWNYLLP